MKRKIASVICIVSLFLFIITFSIGLPIYARPFYFAHITPLGLVESSGVSREEIVTAYNEILDYLTLPGRSFSTGVFQHSASGALHFSDCKRLFTLNATLLLTSACILLALFVLRRRSKLPPLRLGRFSAGFYAGVASILIPLLITGAASINFQKAFLLFHRVFFPGRFNFYFDPRIDGIITVLPMQFFMNCAILIGASVLIFSLILIFVDLRRIKKDNTK